MIACKLGHSAGKVLDVEATIVLGSSCSNSRRMEVVLGERSKGTNGKTRSLTHHNSRVFRFGNKGAKLGDRENRQGRWVWVIIVSELSHLSSVLLETSKFRHRRETSEKFSSRIVKERKNPGR